MRRKRQARAGFSLVELLVAIALLGVLVFLLGSVFASVSSAWSTGHEKAGQLLAGRTVLDTMTQRLSHATLSTRTEFIFDENAPHVPQSFGRESELCFQIGPPAALRAPLPADTSGNAILFFAPTGETGLPEASPYRSLINLCGFFVRFGPGPAGEEEVARRERFRLWEVVLPAEDLPVAEGDDTEGDPWETMNLRPSSRVIAENIPLLVLIPQGFPEEDGETLEEILVYDSTTRDHELPRRLRILFFTISEDSARRVEALGKTDSIVPSGLFRQLDDESIDADVQSLREHLDKFPGQIDYRLFDSVVPLPVSELR
ncbi:MAG: prepilin-type N-terminal cleavage/methylation domain-containing protein [Verrucomicrobiota bacterium]